MSAPVLFYLAGMAALFVGERLLVKDTGTRLIADIPAIIFLITALSLRIRTIWNNSGDRREGEKLALFFTILGISSLLLYAMGLPRFYEISGIDPSGTCWRAFTSIWPIIWLSATLPLVMVDWSLAQMPVLTQPRRVKHAAATGLCIAFAVSLAFPVNYLANRHSRTFDLREISTTAPGEATRSIVESLSEPVEIYLFFPPANDVAREVKPYFDQIVHLSQFLNVEQVDHALAYELSERLKVSSNGSVVLVRGDDIERINLGTSVDGARGALRRFDETFQGKLLQITRSARVVYFTVGHEEMHWRPMDDEPPSRSISGAKRVLEQLNFQVFELGTGEGLGRKIPDDAAAVVIAGPKTPFLPEEIESLRDYVKEGGKLLLLLEGEEKHEALTSLFGIRYHPEKINNDRNHLVRTRTKADRSLLVTNRYSSHPSVGTLARYSSRLLLALDGSGYLEILQDEGKRISATVRSMPQSWADIIPNNEFDEAYEKRDTYNLGIAVSATVGEDNFRGAALANANAISDAYLGNQANVQWLVDTIRWLTEDEALSGLLETEIDVRIQHTREQDVAWFYGTVFGVPLLVLIAGMIHVRRRRKRSMV